MRPDRLAATIAATVSLMGVSSANAATSRGHDKDPTLVQKLTDPEDLPGSDIEISPRALRVLAHSTVKLYEQYTPHEDNPVPPPNGFCTGLKVRVGNNTLISTAAHCFEGLTTSHWGLLDPLAYPQTPALDFASRNTYSYTVTDALEYVSKRQPLARAYGIGISTRTVDRALLRVAPSTTFDSRLGQPKQTYKQLSSIPLRQIDRSPIPGQEVGLLGVPEYNLDRPVLGKRGRIGQYLGRILSTVIEDQGTTDTADDFIATRQVDVVGVDPEQPYEDPFNYGSSGSSFVFETSAAQAVASGPLALRTNSTYDAYLLPDWSAPNLKARTKNAVEKQKLFRQSVETRLGVNTKKFATLGFFSVTEHAVTNEIVAALGRDFAPPFPPSEEKGSNPDIGMK